MAAFEYTALDPAGKQKKGILEADSGRQIRQLLRDQGLVPLSVDTTTGSRRSEGAARPRRWRRRMSALDQALFTRQLATLIGASLPIEEALRAAAQQSEKRHVGALIMGIRSRVLEGHSLASGMAEYPGAFNNLYCSTVRAGEQSGHLDKVLGNLADYTERRFDAQRNVQMALLYPIVLFFMALLIVGGLLVYVVPDIVRTFENTGRDLPWLTTALIATSEFVRGYIVLIVLAVAAVVFAVRWFLRQPDIRLRWDRRKLDLPMAKRITRTSNASRYASTLAILTRSGVPLVEAMNIAADVVSNEWLKRRLSEATQRVSEGTSLRASLESAGYFPAMMLHMVASGEASGELDSMLARVAEYQQEELERVVTTLVRLFEPLMLVFMGGVVMVIVLAILLPIINMNQLVS